MTLKKSWQKYGKPLWMKELSLNRVKNIVAKGEIAQYEKFLLLLQCFQKSSAAEASESVCMRERVNAQFA